jgi:hypothetical protein
MDCGRDQADPARPQRGLNKSSPYGDDSRRGSSLVRQARHARHRIYATSVGGPRSVRRPQGSTEPCAKTYRIWHDRCSENYLAQAWVVKMSRVTRPKVDSVLPSELVEWALQGRIRIPSFQRSYRWDRRDVTRLFDSIFRGYPIGNLLVWQRPAQAAKVTLGHLAIVAPEFGNAYWVVDGQQRITSIVGALTADSETIDPRFRIYFDLGHGQFVAAARNQTIPEGWMPLHITLSTAQANSWIRSRPELTEAQIATADQVVAAIRDYRIPMYIVTGDDDHALRDIFDRMNNYGQSLKSEEIFNALHSVPGERDPSDLHTLAEDVQTFGFGEISERVLMQSLLAIRGPRVDRDFREEFKNNSDRHSAFVDTERAIEQVIEFMRDVADVPHSRLVPYSLYVPILARFVALFGPPRDRAAELLRRWIWRGAVVGIAPQGNTIAMRQSASAVRGDAIESASRLLNLLPPGPKSWEPALMQIGLNRTQAKINILGMLSRKPRLLPLDSDHSLAIVDAPRLLDEGHVLVPILDRDTDLGRSLANRMIYPVPRGHSMLQALAGADSAILASHCIDTPSSELLLSGDFDSFLSRRATALSDIIADHVQRRALFGFRDGPDLSTLFDDVTDDSDDQ